MFYFRDKMLDKPQGSFQPSLVYVQFYFLIGDRFCDVVAFDVIQTSSVYVLCEKQFLDAQIIQIATAEKSQTKICMHHSWAQQAGSLLVSKGERIAAAHSRALTSTQPITEVSHFSHQGFYSCYVQKTVHDIIFCVRTFSAKLEQGLHPMRNLILLKNIEL